MTMVNKYRRLLLHKKKLDHMGKMQEVLKQIIPKPMGNMRET